MSSIYSDPNIWYISDVWINRVSLKKIQNMYGMCKGEGRQLIEQGVG